MRSNEKRLLKIASIIAVSMTIFHFYIVVFGAPQLYVFRGMHLLFALVLVFILFPLTKTKNSPLRIVDMGLIAASLTAVGYLMLNQDEVLMRFQLIDPLDNAQLILGVSLTLLVLEGARRTIGLALPLTAITFIAYGMLFADMSLEYTVDILYLTTDGIFGIPLAVSATYLFLFVLFGALAERLGTGQFFIDLSMAAAGKTTGGPAKVASISSGIFGSISGSAVANIMTTGNFTIPLMKRMGYKPAFAGSVEAVASTGGQIMPPVMGAAAFVMAELLGVSYTTIMLSALIPSLLFFVSVFMAIHFEAKRQGLKGLSADDLPKMSEVLLKRGHYLLPLAVIIAVLFMGYSAAYAAFWGVISLVVSVLLRSSTREYFSLSSLLSGVENGVKNALQVILACACAGIVVGIVAYSGAGLEFTSLIRSVAQDTLVVALVLTAFAAIVIGMGLPTTPAYIVLTALMVPTLLNLGVEAISAHLFVLYFAIMSVITPPVAIGLFAANSISGANLKATAIAALKLGATGYIIPFMFVYGPGLLMQGDYLDIAMACFSALAGVVFIAAGLHGFLTNHLRALERILLVSAAIALIAQGIVTDALGFALAGTAYLLQRQPSKQKQMTQRV